jgi:CheY-like chemotaxis protein
MISGKPCVLVVDDDPVSLGFLTAAIDQCGGTAVPAASADAALATSSTAMLDLLLIDQHLPDANGIELLRRLRARGVAAPAVATSADIAAADQVRLIAAGFAATLRKPAAVAAIHALVRRLIDLPATAVAPQRGDGEAQRNDGEAILDDPVALVAIGGDRATLRALRGLLAGELEALIALLLGNAAASDASGFANSLHRLRASCGFCGAPALGAAAAAFETCLRSESGDAGGTRKTFLQACITTRDALASGG